jgi:SAM-dependent methyltransferase
MDETTAAFDDGAAYERFMGSWSRKAGTIFLEWLATPSDLRWLDIGCGTGAFTELVLSTQSPAAIVGIDPAASQIDYARRRQLGTRADFHLSDAEQLSFHSGSFDVVASALVMTFIRDRPRALAEMVRVCRPGGRVASYVWDLSGGGNPGWPLARALREVGIDPAPLPGLETSSLTALGSLFERAGLDDIRLRTIDVSVTFADLEDYWQSQTPAFSPQGRVIAALSVETRAKLIDTVRALLPAERDGSITYAARANAIASRVPPLNGMP